MNEFIIWDDKYKLFLDENFKDTLQDNGIDYEEDDLYYDDEYYPLCTMDFIMGSDCEPHKDRLSKLFYIGINDINNNKIYTDCSIVKLGNDIGFIKYSPFLSANVFISLSYHKTEQPLMECSLFNINNMEIIDTIQENKLGLIKE